jgi:hypothetical protein
MRPTPPVTLTLVGRIGRPEDTTTTVAFLAREGSAALVGQIVQPDWGTTRGGAWASIVRAGFSAPKNGKKFVS